MTSPISFTSPVDPTSPGVAVDVAVTVAPGTYVESAVITLTGSIRFMPMWAPTGWTLTSTTSSDQTALVVTVTDVSNLPAGATTASPLLTMVAEYFVPQKPSFGPTYTITVNSYTDSSATTFTPTTGNVLNVVAPPACFAKGTQLATPSGPTKVEHLRPGNRVITRTGQVRPIVWTGSRDIDLLTAHDPHLLQPIRFRAHCVANNVPSADLLLSPDHAVLIDGHLIKAHALVNGSSIAPDPVDRVTYFHVELETHDILLAENLPAESLLDSQPRHQFDGTVTALHPVFDTQSDTYRTHGILPLTEAPKQVRTIWQRLATRAASRDASATTNDPCLTVNTEGKQLTSPRQGCGWHRFNLPPRTRSVELHSRTARPSDYAPWTGDRRRLGVAVSAIRIAGHTLNLETLHQGWHPVERLEEQLWRWTNGAALIELPAHDGVLEIYVSSVMDYEASQLPRTEAA